MKCIRDKDRYIKNYGPLPSFKGKFESEEFPHLGLGDIS